jgi:2-iminobutanoate/2-iminopropanoate deaminase
MKFLFSVFFSAALLSSPLFGAPLPFSPSVEAGNFVFVSGQIPKDPVTAKPMKADITTLTHRIFDQIEEILQKDFLTLDDAVRVEIFLKDINDFEEMNQAYATRFHGRFPARQTIQVAKLPFDSAIEISCIAYKKE